MKKQEFIMIVIALLSLCFASCSDDDDEGVHVDQIAGTWSRVYDKDLMDAGVVTWTFQSRADDYGNCTIRVYDVFAGDSVYQRTYTIDASKRKLSLFAEGGDADLQQEDYDIVRLTHSKMTLRLTGTDVVYDFKRKNAY